MFYGIGSYVIAVSLLSAAFSVLLRNYLVSSFVTATIATVLNLLHESWLANFDVNLGWGPPMLVMGFLVGLPVALLAGLPMLAYRNWAGRHALPKSNVDPPTNDREPDF